MKIPENREKFISELRKALDETIPYDINQYTNLGKRPENAGQPTQLEIECGAKCLGVKEWGGVKQLEIALVAGWDELVFYEIAENGNRVFNDWLRFEDYKSKTTLFMAAVVTILRFFN